jgi:protein-S-isoprenylcysteine O-methyltransferase Ste14
LLCWINFFVLIISSILFTYLYIKSVGPAALEKKIGEGAYKKCGTYRKLAMIFEMIIVINYIFYFFLSLPFPIPQFFYKGYWISIIIAIFILIPSAFFMGKGMIDAGEESLIPKKEHALYGGIYEKMRHPQSTGEVMTWWVLAFLLNSPFLALYSLIWIPIFYCFCLAEEKDLIIRYGNQYIEYKNQVGLLFPKKKRDKS